MSEPVEKCESIAINRLHEKVDMITGENPDQHRELEQQTMQEKISLKFKEKMAVQKKEVHDPQYMNQVADILARLAFLNEEFGVEKKPEPEPEEQKPVIKETPRKPRHKGSTEKKMKLNVAKVSMKPARRLGSLATLNPLTT